MSELYSQIASASFKKEAENNVAVIPDSFFCLNDEDLSVEYNYQPSQPIKNSRALNLKAVDGPIVLSDGTININVEPKEFGNFLEGFSDLTSGNYLPMTAPSGVFTAGEEITGGTSAKTATVTADIDGQFLIVSAPSGDFTDGEEITGGTSGKTATLTKFDSTVYAHTSVSPSESTTTFTLQFNYNDRAIRYMGVRFHGIDSLAQSDNIITAGVKTLPQSQFRQGRVTAITTAGAGEKTITVDQTLGLVAADSIKLYRPGTGFIDFSAATVKTHDVAGVTNSTSFTVTNLETATAVGDLILLAPQTANYTVGNEFSFIGGSLATIGDDIDNLATACIEDFTLVMLNELEARYCADGVDFEDRFPSHLLQKGFTGNGTLKLHTKNEFFYRFLRKNTAQAFRIRSIGSDIGVTDMQNEVWFTFAQVQFDTYNTNIGEDNIVDEDIPFSSFYDDTEGHSARMVLINDVASY